MYCSWEEGQRNAAAQGRDFVACALTPSQREEGEEAGEALYQQCVNVCGEGMSRVVFSGGGDAAWALRVGRDLYRSGGAPLVCYAALELAVRLCDEGWGVEDARELECLWRGARLLGDGTAE